MIEKIKEKLPDLAIELIAFALIALIYRLITHKTQNEGDDTFMAIVFSGIVVFFGIIGFRIYFNKSVDKKVESIINKQIEINKEEGKKDIQIAQLIHSKRYTLFQDYRKKLDTYILDVLEPLKEENHFIISMFTGVYKTLLKDIESGGKNTFYIDSDFYPAILELTDETDDIIALADLSDEIETFWRSIPDPNKTTAAKRTFFVPWKIFFDDKGILNFYELLKKHSAFYTVKYNNTPQQIVNPLFPDRLGFNMFACKPGIVGYYAKLKGKTLLKIIFDEIQYNKAYEKINSFTLESVEFNQNYSIKDFRTKWINHNKYGFWIWDDIVVEDRDPYYFIHYDIHIRCWIWMYDLLMSEVIKYAKNELADKAHTTTSQVKVLEIGFGTGTLTIPILEWIENINSSLKDKITAKVKYYGVDRAYTQMFPFLEKKLKETKKIHLLSKHLFVDGVVWDSVPDTIQNRKFDLIIASLVVHDIISKDPQNLFENFVSETAKWLNTGGTILIADLFPSYNQKEREEQIEFWKSWMKSNGMPHSEVERFFFYNEDMVKMVTDKNLKRTADKYGFNCEVHALPHANGKKSPFRIVLLKK
jgi:ubiquinone/menaquinone biosynthesis C-methylase UbiE